MRRRHFLPLAFALPFADRRTDLERTIDFIATQQPDLLALQEVDRNCRRSGSIDQPKVIGEALGMESSFHKFMDYDGGEYGLAILSRLPVKKTLTHQLPEGREPRVAGEVQIERGGTRLSFISLHLDWTTTERRLPQAKALTQGLKDREHPVVLAGDFNAEPVSPTIRHFEEDYHVVRKQGPGLTFPADIPKIEIDFFALRNVEDPEQHFSQVLDERVVSDHRPLVMKL